MTTVTAAAVRTAAVTFAVFVVVVMTVEIGADFESAVGEIFCCGADISFCAADDHDIFACEGIDCACADTAADENVNAFAVEQSSQCAVT